MAYSSIYTTGTVTVAAGATALAGTGTAWADAGVLPGALLFVNGVTRPLAVRSVTSNTAIVLDEPVPSAVTGAAYVMVKLGYDQPLTEVLSKLLQLQTAAFDLDGTDKSVTLATDTGSAWVNVSQESTGQGRWRFGVATGALDTFRFQRWTGSAWADVFTMDRTTGVLAFSASVAQASVTGLPAAIAEAQVHALGLAPIAQISGYADMAALSLVNCTMADNGDGIARFTAVAASGIAMWTLPSISGKRARYAAVRYKRISGAHRGTIFYTTAAHTWSYSYYATWTDPGTGWSTVVYDMWALNGAGGTDWHDSLITGLRMDVSNDATAVFDIEWMAVFGDLPGVPRTAPVFDNSVRVANSGTTDAVIEAEQTAGGTPGALLRLKKAGSTLLALSAYAASGVFEDIASALWRIWRIGGVNKMVLTSGGSLGLGTAGATSPSTKLHVSEVAAGASQEIRVENASTSASSAAAVTAKTGTSGATSTMQVTEDGAGAPTASWSLGSAIVSAMTAVAAAAGTVVWKIGGVVKATLSATSLTLPAGVVYAGDGSGLTNTPAWDLLCQEQQASGTASGASVAATWNVRTLNTLVKNTIGATLSAGVLTVPAGTYDVEWFSVCFGAVGFAKSRLYDPTNAVALAYGSPNGSTTGSIHTISTGRATLTFAAATTIRLDHYTTAAVSTNGLGAAISQGTEVYRSIGMKKVA